MANSGGGLGAPLPTEDCAGLSSPTPQSGLDALTPPLPHSDALSWTWRPAPASPGCVTSSSSGLVHHLLRQRLAPKEMLEVEDLKGRHGAWVELEKTQSARDVSAEKPRGGGRGFIDEGNLELGLELTNTCHCLGLLWMLQILVKVLSPGMEERCLWSTVGPHTCYGVSPPPPPCCALPPPAPPPLGPPLFSENPLPGGGFALLTALSSTQAPVQPRPCQHRIPSLFHSCLYSHFCPKEPQTWPSFLTFPAQRPDSKRF